MANLRTPYLNRGVTTLSAALTALSLAVPAALAADGPEPQRIPMPMPGYENLTANSMAMTTHAERCRIFEHRFDAEVKTHGDSAKLDEAKTLRIEGERLCGGNNSSLGIQKLREALSRIGVDNDL